MAASLKARSAALQRQRETVALKDRGTTNEKIVRRQQALRTQFAEAPPGELFMSAAPTNAAGTAAGVAQSENYSTAAIAGVRSSWKW